MKNNVLIIDADINNGKQIKYALRSTDTEVYYTHSVSEALHMIQTRPYTLIILDVLLSCDGGFDLLREIRQMNNVPILALSEQASSAERVLAMKCGADDVLNKPYHLSECLIRAQALMQRYTEHHKLEGRSYAIVGFEDLMLDTAMRKVSVAGKEITLTRKEYDILLYLLTHRRQVLTYSQIYDAVWQDVFLADCAVVPYHISNLRQKIGKDWIETVYGVGYHMRDPR